MPVFTVFAADRWFGRLSFLARGARSGVILTALCCLVVGQASADEVISLHYNPRVPYEALESGDVRGIVADPIAAAFRKADVAFRWVETPGARQFHIVKLNQGHDCLAGRFRNADRESWARFSKPVYRDLPQGLLVRADNERIKAFSRMEDALRATNNRILVKLAYSYGPVIDGWLKQRDRPTMVTADENVEMLRQIHLGVADAFVIAEEEATGLIQRSGLPPDNLEFLRFADAPPGEFRYIMCSHMVPPRVMQKLDAAINFKSR